MAKLQEMTPETCRCFKVQNRSFTSRETIHLQFAPAPKPSQATNAGAPKLPPQPQSPRRQQARQRRSCRHGPAVPKGGRRKAPRPPPTSPQRPRALTSVQRPQPTTAPSQVACSSVTAGGGRASSEHSADQCGACPRLRRSRTRRHTWSRTF